MTKAAVIFPHQLFRENPCLKKDRGIYLVEDQWFFRDPVNQLKFHRQKLILHRATMQAYREFLEGQGFLVHYLEFVQDPHMGYLFDRLRQDGVDEIVICQLLERGLTERLTKQAARQGVKLNLLPTPGFLCSEADIGAFFAGRKTYHQTSFYIYQRRRWDILLEEGKPAGGRWTYDPLNRRKLPQGLAIPRLPDADNEPYVSAAREYISQKFPSHPGETSQLEALISSNEGVKACQDYGRGVGEKLSK